MQIHRQGTCRLGAGRIKPCQGAGSTRHQLTSAWVGRFIHVTHVVGQKFPFQLPLEGNKGRNPVCGRGQRRGKWGRDNKDEVEGSRTPKLPLWPETGTDLLTRSG